MIERIKHIDIVAGIMILWMIFQHAVQSAWAIDSHTPGELYEWNPNVWFPYLNFFMPWFFYKSGFFFEKRGIAELWHKDYKKLLRTFIVLSIVGYGCFLLLGCYDNSLTFKDIIYTPTRRFFFHGFIAINSPLWFLLSLVAIRFLANITLPQREDSYFHLKCVLLFVSAAMIATLAFFFRNPLLPLWIANIASGLAFFSLGYWLHDYEQKIWLMCVCVLGYACSCVWGWNSVCMHTNVLLEGHYLLWFPSALCGIVVVNNACRLYVRIGEQIPPPRSSRYGLLGAVEKYAMPIYVTHSFIRYPIERILVHTNHLLPWVETLLIICLGYVLLLPPICILWRKYIKM